MKFVLKEIGKVIPFPNKPATEPSGEEVYDADAFEPAPDPEPEDFGPDIEKRMRFTLVPDDQN